MAFRLTRPTDETLRSLLDAGRDAELTYSPVGLAMTTDVPAGYRLDRWERRLGRGGIVFDDAVQALREWAVHRGAGLSVCADGPLRRASSSR